MDDQATARVMIARIRDARFRTTRWGGYDEREVDSFLDELLARLDRGQPVGDDPAPLFSTSRMRPGYRKADVDAFFRNLAS